MIRHVRKGIKRFWAALTLLTLELIVILVIFFAALFLFLFIAKMVFLENKDALDIAVFGYLDRHVSDTNTDIMQFFTFLGTHYFLIAANLLLIAYFLFIKKHRWYSIKIPAISLSSLLLMSLLKQIFNRQRPLVPLMDAAHGLSFPSGHAMMSFAFYGLIIYLVYENIQNRLVKWTMIVLLFLMIIAIGVSRVYLRVHYASDVIAGFCMGIIWLFISLFFLNKMERISKKEIDLVVETEEKK